MPTEVYLLPPLWWPYTSFMVLWLAIIFFLIVITCLCVAIHWQCKRRRTKV